MLSVRLGYLRSILCVTLLLKYCNDSLMMVFTDWNMEIDRVIQNDCWGFNNLSYTIHLS